MEMHVKKLSDTLRSSSRHRGVDRTLEVPDSRSFVSASPERNVFAVARTCAIAKSLAALKSGHPKSAIAQKHSCVLLNWKR